ncbi:zinc finger BED domain-containing protein 1 [Scaptodrosophila lebanonensis]|uniref:Zinc finger BED domain-containing protein 1 n=1 Tax=Drosophila lebanonensis TaxID=7225 RepID=A0A6J2TMH1_DROLE|nr:zinc finger BED domain-containing protein 1 [Scaptodrosophila lebanonensis]
MARSKIWKYYEKLDNNCAQCQLCEKIIKTSGNTSNLMKHMKTHPQVDVNDTESVVIRGIYKREADAVTAKKRSKKLSSHLHIKQEDGQIIKAENVDIGEQCEYDSFGDSRVAVAVDSAKEMVEDNLSWPAEVESESLDGQATVIADDIIEFEPSLMGDGEQCEGETLYQLEELPLANLEEVETYTTKNRQNVQKNLENDQLAYFVCRDKHPLEIIQGDGFKQLMHAFCPIYRLPTVEQLSVHINKLAQRQTAVLRQRFANLSTIALSCAICSTTTNGNSNSKATRLDAQQQLELVAHFYEGDNWRSRTLIVQSLPVHYNAGNIVEWLDRTCNRFDIDKSKIVCVVTKNSRLLENAVAALLGAGRHLPCFGEILESVFEMVVQRHEFASLCEKVRRYVLFYLSTGVPSMQLQLELDEKQHPITTYEMLERYVQLAPQLDKLLRSQLDAPPSLTPIELEICHHLLAVLKPLANAARELCRPDTSSYPSASKALPIAYTIINELKQSRSSEHKYAYELRLFLVRQLEERFETMEKNIFLAMASLLDPRFRNMPFQSSALVAKYMTQLYDQMQHHEEIGMETACTAEDDFWTAYKALSHEKHKHSTVTSDCDDEIATYFCNNISSLQVEPMLLWKDLAQIHPFLYSLAKKYLHIPATATPPVRIFTSAEAEVAIQREKLRDEQMNNILFMADCTKEEWQL